MREAPTIIGATSLAQLKENIDAIDAIHARIPNPGQ
jgi:aryl-alcohol dehydrogenase-like predicted oxidoreductase